MVAKHVYMGLSCMAAEFQRSLINQKGDFHANLIRESWEGKEKVILALLKPLQISFYVNNIAHKINHGKNVKQMVIL